MVNHIGQFVEKDHDLVKKVMVDIDAYYTYETHTADGSFRVFDSYVRAGADYDGHLPPNRVKMRHELLIDLSAMSPYGVLTFAGEGLIIVYVLILEFEIKSPKKLPCWLFIALGPKMSANGSMGHLVAVVTPIGLVMILTV